NCRPRASFGGGAKRAGTGRRGVALTLREIGPASRFRLQSFAPSAPPPSGAPAAGGGRNTPPPPSPRAGIPRSPATARATAAAGNAAPAGTNGAAGGNPSPTGTPQSGSATRP